MTQAAVDRLRQQRHAPGARAGWDLVFRPPKSYSVLWAVGSERVSSEIRDIHHEAVADALGYLEQSAGRGRTTTDVGKVRKRVRAASGGFVVAAFDHRDSRAGDPLLHTHCVVANATRLDDGRWTALDPKGLYRHGLAADAVYQATFRHMAERRLGLASEPVVNGWADVAGVPRSVVEHFSKRSEEIAAELARVGSDSAGARQIAAVATRRAKATRRGTEGLHERWRAEAASIGFGREAVDACLGRVTCTGVDPDRIEALFNRLAGARGLTESSATFTRGDVVTALAGAMGGSVRGSELVVLAERFLASRRAVQVREHRAGLPRERILDAGSRAFVDDLAAIAFTTPELADIETRLMAVATGSTAAPGPVAEPDVIEEVLASRPGLSDDQKHMVRTGCGTASFMRPVVGYPGSGKTYATEACVSAFRASGTPVVGCAVTAAAADELARATGLGAACDTIARTLIDLDHPRFGGLAAGSVVIVDEASTVGHRDLDRLVDHIQAVGGCLVLVGDPHQHGAVGPGHFFGWLCGQDAAGASTLRSNHRQRDVVDGTGTVIVSLAAERAANQEFREGRIGDALARRDEAGLVTRAPTAAELQDAMVADWFAGWQAGNADPMITTRNAARHQLNLRARARLADAGALCGPSLEVAGTDFRAGDHVIARENSRRLRARSDRTWWVRNGSRGTVAEVHLDTGELTVDFAGHDCAAKTVRLPAAYLRAGHLEWAYAVTDYAVQGRTLSSGRALVDDTTSAAGLYVGTTRGRLDNRIYVVDGTVAEAREVDTSHGPPSVRETGLEAIASRLVAEAPPALIHEIDRSVGAADCLATTRTLAELHAALAVTSAVLAGAPPDVSRRIAGVDSALEDLGAHRQLLAAQLRDLRSEGGGRDPGDPHLPETLAARLARTDLRATGLIETRAELEAQAERRQAFLTEHAADVERRELLRDSIAGRETKVRLAAPILVPAAARAWLPESAVAGSCDGHRRWRRAIEATALYLDRWAPESGPTQPGSGAGPSGATGADLLGARPTDTEGARHWDEAMAALAEVATPDITPASAPELSPVR